jgi:hypothetical protein
MIRFAPERLGHCVFLDDANMAALLASRIAVETCLSCHYRCYAIPMKDNIFRHLFPRRQAVLGTDNPAFYLTDLVEECVAITPGCLWTRGCRFCRRERI